jgi:hypothetical protein
MILDQVNSKVQNLTMSVRELLNITSRLSKLQEAVGRIEARQLRELDYTSLSDTEFRVFSQWGEDGIIQFLIRNINIKNKVFIEFGVQDYTESSTRFLLINNNWTGLVIDGSLDNIEYIKKDPIYWQYNLKAEHTFITKDNINDIFTRSGIQGEIGLLSVDIDGNDYWVWQAIDSVNPAIVVSEYNYRFGAEKAVTVPYKSDFVRSNAHCSMIYYGASLKALCLLADQKGYAFVGCNSAGNNAFFVRRDLKPDLLKELTPEEGYVAGKFRESRGENGSLTYLSHQEEQTLLSALPLVEIG